MDVDKLVFSVPRIDTHIDRFLRWMPATTVLVSRMIGLPAKHHIVRRVSVVVLASILMQTATQSLKHGVHRGRPGMPLDNKSFPSSHTGTAFAGAEILRREFARTFPMFSWAGFFPAILTAILRLSKRRHWPSDVLAGALIGVVVARVAYKLTAKR